MDEADRQRFEVECIAQRAEAIGLDPDRVRQALSRRAPPDHGGAAEAPVPARRLVPRLLLRRSGA